MIIVMTETADNTAYMLRAYALALRDKILNQENNSIRK